MNSLGECSVGREGAVKREERMEGEIARGGKRDWKE